jgi:acyl-coenzyme A thioesterase PaaI-like protein
MASKQEIIAFLHREFPDSPCTVDDISPKAAVVRYKVDTNSLRPGGTVSGPVLMTTADLGLYAAILGEIGIVPLAVTTNLNINFLGKPRAGKDIIGVCTLIKVGRLLIIGEVSLYSEGDDRPVAHAVGTYAIPPQNPV